MIHVLRMHFLIFKSNFPVLISTQTILANVKLKSIKCIKSVCKASNLYLFRLFHRDTATVQVNILNPIKIGLTPLLCVLLLPRVPSSTFTQNRP